MSEPFIGQVMLFAGNFAPRGWAFCQGQILAINQYSALFSVLGNTYGGDGRTTFALPNLSGRVPVGQGQGPGLNPVQIGQTFGEQNTTLGVANIPAHSHEMTFSLPDPEPAVPPTEATSPAGYTPSATPGPKTAQTTAVGGGQPFSNQPPSLGMNYIIALEGIYPSRG